MGGDISYICISVPVLPGQLFTRVHSKILARLVAQHSSLCNNQSIRDTNGIVSSKIAAKFTTPGWRLSYKASRV